MITLTTFERETSIYDETGEYMDGDVRELSSREDVLTFDDVEELSDWLRKEERSSGWHRGCGWADCHSQNVFNPGIEEVLTVSRPDGMGYDAWDKIIESVSVHGAHC